MSIIGKKLVKSIMGKFWSIIDSGLASSSGRVHQYLPYNGSTIDILSSRGIPILVKRQHYWFPLKRRNIFYCNTGDCCIGKKSSG